MHQYIFILITLVVASNAAIAGYRYPQPQAQRPQPQPIPIGIRPPQHHSNNGIYSAPPATPIQQFNLPAPTPQLSAPPAISLPSAPQELSAAPAPVVQPQQQYLPPQQQQQIFSQPQAVPQFAQQNVQSVQSFAQQQVVHQQQLSQPIQPSFQSFQQQPQQQQQRPQQTAIITKDIFIHSAPEDNDFDVGSGGPQLELGPVRKNYRIVFIKAPSQNLRGAAAALQRAQSKNEEKTIIYVLSKKPDLTEVHQQLQQSHGEQKVNKPEVYFIKYKTQEEAERAQKEIQAQYDALGGSTHISNEGIAPVTTVGGITGGALNLGTPIGAGVSSYHQQGAGIQQQSFGQQSFQSHGGVSNSYLPPSAVKK